MPEKIFSPATREGTRACNDGFLIPMHSSAASALTVDVFYMRSQCIPSQGTALRMAVC